MSDNWLCLIPADPAFVPPSAARASCQRQLRTLLPNAEDISVELTEDPRFIDPGSNWESVHCPRCDADLADWWPEAMGAAHENGFRSLAADVPCCHAAVSLNELRYSWPAGFARFSLDAGNPGVTKLDAADLEALAQCLGTPLRVVWRHL